jgi:hypothetical protein
MAATPKTKKDVIEKARVKLKALPKLDNERTPEESILDLKVELLDALTSKGYKDDIDALIEHLKQLGIKGGKTRLAKAVRALLNESATAT